MPHTPQNADMFVPDLRGEQPTLASLSTTESAAAQRSGALRRLSQGLALAAAGFVGGVTAQPGEAQAGEPDTPDTTEKVKIRWTVGAPAATPTAMPAAPAKKGALRSVAPLIGAPAPRGVTTLPDGTVCPPTVTADTIGTVNICCPAAGAAGGCPEHAAPTKKPKKKPGGKKKPDGKTTPKATPKPTPRAEHRDSDELLLREPHDYDTYYTDADKYEANPVLGGQERVKEYEVPPNGDITYYVTGAENGGSEVRFALVPLESRDEERRPIDFTVSVDVNAGTPELHTVPLQNLRGRPALDDGKKKTTVHLPTIPEGAPVILPTKDKVLLRPFVTEPIHVPAGVTYVIHLQPSAYTRVALVDEAGSMLQTRAPKVVAALPGAINEDTFPAQLATTCRVQRGRSGEELQVSAAIPVPAGLFPQVEEHSDADRVDLVLTRGAASHRIPPNQFADVQSGRPLVTGMVHENSRRTQVDQGASLQLGSTQPPDLTYAARRVDPTLYRAPTGARCLFKREFPPRASTAGSCSPHLDLEGSVTEGRFTATNKGLHKLPANVVCGTVKGARGTAAYCVEYKYSGHAQEVCAYRRGLEAEGSAQDRDSDPARPRTAGRDPQPQAGGARFFRFKNY
ncbi:hypothetical protein CO046_05345 [Candidatus Peregrinibacteria bacterium CG_4_9_14_0_2_um_filter_53_11]|nr:MAG: hypothetical protein CO046_05345 [Candidatus Peregrinibacteria bacterium CG_4_9_14_0_2_um_filter_53_11]